MSGVVISQYWLDQMDNPSTIMTSTITALYDVGAVFGALLAALTAEQLGRKRALMFGSVLLIIGCVLMGAAMERIMMMFGRVFTGLGASQLNWKLTWKTDKGHLLTSNRYWLYHFCRASLSDGSLFAKPARMARSLPVNHAPFRIDAGLLDQLRLLLSSWSSPMAFPLAFSDRLRSLHLSPNAVPAGYTQMAHVA